MASALRAGIPSLGARGLGPRVREDDVSKEREDDSSRVARVTRQVASMTDKTDAGLTLSTGFAGGSLQRLRWGVPRGGFPVVGITKPWPQVHPVRIQRFDEGQLPHPPPLLEPPLARYGI